MTKCFKQREDALVKEDQFLDNQSSSLSSKSSLLDRLADNLSMMMVGSGASNKESISEKSNKEEFEPENNEVYEKWFYL